MSKNIHRLSELIRVVSGESDPALAINKILEGIKSAGYARARVYIVSRYEKLSETPRELSGFAQIGSHHDFGATFREIRLAVDDKDTLNSLTIGKSAIMKARKPLDFSTIERESMWVDSPISYKGKIIGRLVVDNGGMFSNADVKFVKQDLEFIEIISFILSQHLHVFLEDEDNPAKFLTNSKKSRVLILGKDTIPELELLRNIEEIVHYLGYKPRLVKDVPDIPEMTNEEKVRALADASRFVIIENSFPAGQIAEMKILATNRIVTAIIRQESKGSTWMVGDYDLDYQFMEEFVYAPDDIASTIKNACEWANNLVKERTKKLDERYPWRKKGK